MRLDSALLRYVLTGAPGSGKTTVLRALADLGFPVVAEAATDVIAAAQRRGTARPWEAGGFLDAIVALQRERLTRPPAPGQPPPPGRPQVHDRSVLCTVALARFLGRPVTAALAAEADRVTGEGVFERTVFLIRPVGFVVPTAARRISYAESLEFERVHEDVYREHGFEIAEVAPGAVAERAAAVAAAIRDLGG
jgi:predicted ATPase